MSGDRGSRAAHRRSLVVAKARKKLEPPLQSGQYPAVRSGAGGRSAVFKATDLLGQMLQSGMSRWTAQRLRHAMAWQIDEQGTGRSGMFPGLAETAPEFRDAEAAGAPDGGSGGSGGGNAMALLGGLAFAALGGTKTAAPAARSAAVPQEHAADPEDPEQSATLILAAMINAAKADGQIDQEELQRIVGKLRETGADAEALDFVMAELRKPADLDGLIRQVPSERVAVQLYAASLLAIDVDTEAERRYLRRLAHGLGLDPGVVRQVHECLDAPSA